MAEIQNTLSPGKIARQQIMGVAGDGGMGVVYKAFDSGLRKHVPSQRWMTFVRNHAQAIVAWGIFIAYFRVLYVFVLPIEFLRSTGHVVRSEIDEDIRETAVNT
jgi:hypothetical protein